MNAVCNKVHHLNSLSYSRKLVLNRAHREPTRCNSHFTLIQNQSIISRINPYPKTVSKVLPNSTFTRTIHLLTDDDKCSIPTHEIRRLVKSNFKSYKEGFTCITINCPSCGVVPSKESKSDLGKLYINLRTGYCFCTQCFLQGPWSNLNTYIKAVEMSNLKSEKASSK